jgi:hypothetical protein
LLLFLNWATTATGPLLPYHGYFLFGLHVIALWLLLAIVFDAFHPDPLSAFPKVCMLAAPALVFPLATSFRMPTPDVPLIREAFAALRPHLTERTELEIYASAPSANSHWPFAGGSSVWPITAGLANEIHRSGKRFCVHPDWVMMFGPANICPPDSPLPKVAYLPPTAVVSEPCKELYLHQHIKLVLIPSPDDDLPMKVGPSDCRDSKTGFHANEGVHRWTSKLSTISFPLTAGQLATLAHAELNIKGGLHKGPLLIFVNNTKVGEISEPGDPADGRFPIPEGVLRAGQKNQVRLEAPSATGMSGDTREMGYLFRGLEIKRTPAK